MLAPVLEIYIVYHPEDSDGAERAGRIVDHFHGTAYSGLIGGAVEVYERSDPWGEGESPRPLPFQEAPAYGIPAPSLIAIVPILSLELARALQGEGDWFGYLNELAAVHRERPAEVGMYPIVPDQRLLEQEHLGQLYGGLQALGTGLMLPGDETMTRQIRDLVQGIAQQAAAPENQRVRVFISHTKRATREGPDQILRIERVFDVINRTRLERFFDATDLQPGRDWEQELLSQAATSALLCVRTDLYSSREWCQKEVSLAKRAGVPVVILDALQSGEERGCFLMDHVPRIPGNDATEISEAAVITALNQLVDECLKRELWRRQKELADPNWFDWWAPHAPEPITLVDWLHSSGAAGGAPDGRRLRVLHPDPPLGVDEVEALRGILALTEARPELEVLTPRTLASGSE